MRLQKEKKIGRNDKCICGSNIKYKKCCLVKEMENRKKQIETMRKAEDACKQEIIKEEN
jgi:hypothetical protein